MLPSDVQLRDGASPSRVAAHTNGMAAVSDRALHRGEISRLMMGLTSGGLIRAAPVGPLIADLRSTP